MPIFSGVYARVTTFLTWIKANMETTPAPQPPAPAPQPPAPAPQPPAPAPQPPAPAPTTCAIPEYSKDEYCDDENNTPECNYDNGACCTDTSQTYCTKCECKQNQSPAPQPPAPAPQPPAPAPQPPAPAPTTCAVPQYSTDEFCDDENNTAACNYDNGACCTDTSQMYCTVCECKQNSG